MARDSRLARAAPERLTHPRNASGPKLDKTAQTRIGHHLRAMYDDLVQQPVPDRFAALLAQLEEGTLAPEDVERTR
jgi:hypothetical protein